MTQQKAAEGNMLESEALPGGTAPASNRLLTIEQVAKYLQLTPETVRAMARNGEIPAFKIRQRFWRFRERDVEAWVQQMVEDEV